MPFIEHVRRQEPTPPAALRRQAEAEAATIELERFLYQKLEPAEYDWVTNRVYRLVSGTFKERVRHRRRPHLLIQRPGLGIEHLMIDSGAFSANSLGRTIDLDVYCDFVLPIMEWRGVNVLVVNVDHIDANDRNQPQHWALPITSG